MTNLVFVVRRNNYKKLKNTFEYADNLHTIRLVGYILFARFLSIAN